MAELDWTPLRHAMMQAVKAGSVRMGDDSRWHCLGFALDVSTPAQRGRTFQALWLNGYIDVINEGRTEPTAKGTDRLAWWDEHYGVAP